MYRSLLFLAFFCAEISETSAGSEKNRPFPLPRPEEIVAFTNGLAPATDGRIEKRKEDVMRFLKHGRPNWNEPISYDFAPAGNMMNQCDGVLLDNKGRFYFWSFNNPKLLVLQVPDGRYVLLDLRR